MAAGDKWKMSTADSDVWNMSTADADDWLMQPVAAATFTPKIMIYQFLLTVLLFGMPV
jgi:hypothetical protein